MSDITQFSSLSFQNAWVPPKISCLAWFLGDVSITQNSKFWVMDDENWKQNFGVFSFWNMSYGGKTWVMWPNNNFGVFEIKWGLGYELWDLSLSYEDWVLSYENWVMAKPNELLFSCEKLLRLYAIGFCNRVLPNFHFLWSEELCSQHLFKLLELVTYLGSV